MSTPRMEPIRDAEGNFAPDKDKRDVPLRIMAQYMGVHPHTLYMMVQRGGFPPVAKAMHGRKCYYRPWLWVSERSKVSA